MKTNKDSVTTQVTLKCFFKETLPSSSVFITWFKMPANSTQNGSISVDEYTETLLITITPVTLKSEVVLYSPNGTVLWSKFEEFIKFYSFHWLNIIISGTVVSLSENEETELSNNVLKISILVSKINLENGNNLSYKRLIDKH